LCRLKLVGGPVEHVLQIVIGHPALLDHDLGDRLAVLRLEADRL
jgi:hypothetical protein